MSSVEDTAYELARREALFLQFHINSPPTFRIHSSLTGDVLCDLNTGFFGVH